MGPDAVRQRRGRGGARQGEREGRRQVEEGEKEKRGGTILGKERKTVTELGYDRDSTREYSARPNATRNRMMRRTAGGVRTENSPRPKEGEEIIY